MTCTGWIALRSKYWVSSLGGLRPSRWPWCLRRGCRLRNWPTCRSWRWKGYRVTMLARCWSRCWLGRWVKDQIVAETRGNPLALLELPRGLTLGELAGGFGLPSAVPLYAQIEQSFNRQLTSLPAQT